MGSIEVILLRFLQNAKPVSGWLLPERLCIIRMARICALRYPAAAHALRTLTVLALLLRLDHRGMCDI